MTIKICLRCDWQGETEEPRCPECGERPLYVVSAPASGKTTMSPRTVAGVSDTSNLEPSRRPVRPVVHVGLAAVVLAIILGAWVRAQEDRPALRGIERGGVGDSSRSSRPAATADASALQRPPTKRVTRTVAGIPFSFRLPVSGWEEHRRISVNKSTMGPQGAEGIVFWTSFPDGDEADPCSSVLSPPDDPTPADLAAAAAAAPGIDLVRGPNDVIVGGHHSKHVMLTVRERVGCDPGFFYAWHPQMGGALWTETSVGDTIHVWIVDVDGALLFIEAETTEQAGPGLEREIRQIVGSIRFD
jgi:hypothetical protein